MTGDEPAPTITAGPNGKGSPRNVTGSAAARRKLDAIRAAAQRSSTGGGEPAMTITGSADNGNFRWVHERPSATIVGQFNPEMVAPPRVRRAGDTSKQDDPEAVSVTLEEAALLQSFPPDFPWQGSRTKRFEQIGNAIPPLLARRLLESVTHPSNPTGGEKT